MEQEAVSELSALCCETNSSNDHTPAPLLLKDSTTDDTMNSIHSHSSLNSLSEEPLNQFPPLCRRLVCTIPGNNRCIDCGTLNPEWASITYGILLCTPCAGRHRSFGVHVSKVRSLIMDNWSYSQIVAMLEGGNEQLHKFFERHSLIDDEDSSQSSSSTSSNNNKGNNQNGEATKSQTTKSNGTTNNLPIGGKNSSIMIDKRYHTNAAKFYRDQLAIHVQKCKQDGWKGRGVSRKKKRSVKSNINSVTTTISNVTHAITATDVNGDNDR